MLKDFPGVQDVFCGPETIIHLKSGAEMPDAAALEDALVKLEVATDGIERDDSAML